MRTSKHSVWSNTHRNLIRPRYYHATNEETAAQDVLEAALEMADRDQEMHKPPDGISVDENHVYFYAPILERQCLELVKLLHKLDIEMGYLQERLGLNYRPPIHLHIHSPGGDVFSSLNICDIVRRSKTDIHTYIEGSVASAATLISMCGVRRTITSNSFMLLHQPSMIWAGKRDEFIDEIENQKHIYDKLTKIYLERSKMKKKELDDLLKHELWLPAERCLELGLVDEIL